MTRTQRIGLIAAGAAIAVLAAATVVVALVEAADDRGHTVSAPRGDRREATFELASGVPAVTVRAAELGDDLYRIETPAGAGARPRVADRDGAVRLTLAGGPASAVTVRLSTAVLWRVRVAAGTGQQALDLGAGRVSGVDLIGGAQRVDVILPPAEGTLPVRLTGGAGQVSVRLRGDEPARVAIGSGAATVAVDGRQWTGVAGGTVLEPPGWSGARDRYDVDIAAGVATLTVDRLP